MFRDTYTNGSPMTHQDKRDHMILTLASIGGVALLVVGIVLLAILGGSEAISLPLMAIGVLTFVVLDNRER